MTLEEATAKSTQLNIMFMETSAKAGHNVKSLFKKIAMSLPGMEKDTQGEPNTSVEHFFFRCSDLIYILRNRCHDNPDHGVARSGRMQLLIISGILYS